jgi:hypothetical protein
MDSGGLAMEMIVAAEAKHVSGLPRVLRMRA